MTLTKEEVSGIAVVLYSALQAVEAIDASLREKVPERYRRMVLGANHLGDVAISLDRLREQFLLALHDGEGEGK